MAFQTSYELAVDDGFQSYINVIFARAGEYRVIIEDASGNIVDDITSSTAVWSSGGQASVLSAGAGGFARFTMSATDDEGRKLVIVLSESGRNIRVVGFTASGADEETVIDVVVVVYDR